MRTIFSLMIMVIFCGHLAAQIKTPTGVLTGKPNAQTSGAVQKMKEAADMNEYYTLEFTILPMEGSKKLNLLKENAVVNVLFTDGFYVTAPVIMHGNKVFGLTRVKRKLKDTAISHIEVILNKNPSGSAGDQWELFDMTVRCMASAVSNPSKNFLWEERNFFPAMQVIKPGQVVKSLVKRPMQQNPEWLKENYYVSMLDVVFMIGGDDIKTNYSALNIKISTTSKPGEYYTTSVAGNGDLRNLLKGEFHLFSTNEEQWNKLNTYGRIWKNEKGVMLPIATKISEVSHILLEYNFGDHGAFENDDWDITGLCVNVRLKENYGFRYYTGWNVNKRMTRTSQLVIK